MCLPAPAPCVSDAPDKDSFSMSSILRRNERNGIAAVDAPAFGFAGAAAECPQVWSYAGVPVVKRTTKTMTKHHGLRPEETSTG